MRNTVQKATSTHIIGEGAVKDFIYQCIHNIGIGAGFHPDTPFEDYIEEGEQMFSEEEAEELNNTMSECIEQCQQLGLDIYDITLKVIGEREYLWRDKSGRGETATFQSLSKYSLTDPDSTSYDGQTLMDWVREAEIGDIWENNAESYTRTK